MKVSGRGDRPGLIGTPSTPGLVSAIKKNLQARVQKTVLHSNPF